MFVMTTCFALHGPDEAGSAISPTGRRDIPTSFWRRCGAGVFVLSAVVFGADHLRADELEEPAALSRVIRGLIRWQESFGSIRLLSHDFCREVVRSRNPAFPDDAQLDGLTWGTRTTLWYENSFRIRYSQEELNGESVEARRLRAVDGFRIWLTTSSQGDPNQYSRIDVHPLQSQASPQMVSANEHPLRSQFLMLALKGLWQENQCCWLGDRLQQNSRVEYLGPELVEDHPCEMVRTSERISNLSAVGSYQEIWWLDPELQYLPRKYVRLDPYYNSAAEIRNLTSVWLVSEFQTAKSDNSADRPIVVPLSGTYQREYLRGRSRNLIREFYEWKITEVTVPHSIPDAILEPPAPTPLTIVYNNEFALDPGPSPIPAGPMHLEAAVLPPGATMIETQLEPLGALRRIDSPPPGVQPVKPASVRWFSFPLAGSAAAFAFCIFALWQRSRAKYRMR